MASVLLRPNREICSPSRRTSTRYSDRIFLLSVSAKPGGLIRLDGPIGGMGPKCPRGWSPNFVMRASWGGSCTVGFGPRPFFAVPFRFQERKRTNDLDGHIG